MSVIPDRITIKRRRDEDPVDALYLPGKRHRSDLCWRRIMGGDTLPLTLAEIHDNTTIWSSIEATSEAKSLEQALSTSNVSFFTTNDAKRHSDRAEAQNVGRKRVTPSFHLAKITRQPSYSLQSPHSGVRKSKKHQERKLSVSQTRAGPTRRDGGVQSQVDDHDARENKTPIIDADQTRPRKRPNICAAEHSRKLATQENYERKLAQKPPDARSISKRLDLASEELALQLNAVALQEVGNQTKKPQVISNISKPKFQPKQPPSRQHPERTASREAFNPADIAVDSAAATIDDYTYDMYLKSDFLPDSKMSCDAVTPDPSTELPLQNFGYLIDENAEDFYGNDYPEDELSSNEGSSQGAYEVGSQNSDWSEECV
ncbi:MAG: hypothetical protein OHK93_008119 [Ramalina farinacea]|uniref:Transcription factor Iwr1 domain-containing protein n=1 Tax=Ramalina farinacea TaxID=258253 RepID=A0AA43QQ86_9LECA|nr:hypothetical protein [Ramalina farinacea]